MDPLNIELVKLVLKSVIQPALDKTIREVASKAVAAKYEATVLGSGAIAQGPAAAAGQGGIAVGGEVTGAVSIGDGNVIVGRDIVSGDKVSGDQLKPGSLKETTVEETPVSETAFQKIADSSAFIHSQLQLSYSQAREQAYTWFRFSIIASGIGFVLVGIGVIAVVFGQLTEGVIAAISSVVPNTVAALFFLQSKVSNERIDAIQRKLSEAREVEIAVEIANSIETKRERDRLKAEIVRKVIGFVNEPTKPA